MTGLDRHRTGAQMEEAAAEFLARNGVRILERNYRVRQAEIDIVGEHKGTLIFVEVKARRGRKSGMPSEAVGDAKQKKICRCADHYMYAHRIDPYARSIRFDVVTIGEEEERRETALPAADRSQESGTVLRDPARHMRWIRGAFDYRTGKPAKPHWRVF